MWADFLSRSDSFSTRPVGCAGEARCSGCAGPHATESLTANSALLVETRPRIQLERFLSALQTVRDTMLSSWMHGLLAFVPVGLWAFLSNASPMVVFITNSIAIVPLSSLLTEATEKIADDAGDTIGAFLNISLGNLVELILFVALKHHKVHIVQASILGSVLVNLLPILGTALCVSGLTHDDPVLNTAETQLLSCLLFVSVFVFLIPAAFNYTFRGVEGGDTAILRMSRASSLMVLLIYILYFVHELRTHAIANSYRPASLEMVDTETMPHLDRPSSSHLSTPPPRTTRCADEDARSTASSCAGTHIELGDVRISESDPGSNDDEEAGVRKSQKPTARASRTILYDPPMRSRNRSRSHATNGSGHGGMGRNSVATSANRVRLVGSGLASLHTLRSSRANLDNVRVGSTRVRRPLGERMLSVLLLTISSALMSMCAEFLVGTIDEVTRQGHLSESVIGLIILPVVGNVAEYVTVVTVATREKIDLAIAVAIGSSIQIALCVAPLTVIAGWIMHRELSLSFSLFEVAALLGTALLVNFLTLSDASSILRTSGLKGALMCACYIIVG
ncbi:Vacuolar calcium ion transporter 5 [Colletotrichum chlorophyti]|uniref:Vacuolar calcium ion transporter 5 n=1 Tax=Colletotrichum chlorophyti TaxID=708187 RepID=A0A1Q8RAS0_9PEZI|nr:Vacuolar calcium ion transporter 5 [Colletotrichum chlorophyti]